MSTSHRGYWGAYKVALVGTLTTTGTTKAVLSFGQPVDVKRFILVTTTAVTIADGKITVGKQGIGAVAPSSHSAYTLPFTGSAVLDVKEILVGVPDTAAVVAVDGLDTHAATPNLLEIDVDEELFIVSDGVPTAGIVEVWVQVQERGFHLADARTGPAVALVRGVI